MPRIARYAPGGLIYHVINRANGRLRLFKKDDDFLAFERVFLEAYERTPIRVLAWCCMGNHWHLVLWPRGDGELTAFMRWLTLTHAQRWKHAHDAVGHGHLYQGRFKSFPIQRDSHLLAVLRYVEANPLRAEIVTRAQQWQWGSCHVCLQPDHVLHPLLSEWPIPRPRDWLELVNHRQSNEEQATIQMHLTRSRPYGSENWIQRTAKMLHLEHTLRERGRQKGWRKTKGRK